MGARRIFSRGAILDFSRGAKKYLEGRPKVVKFQFFYSKLRKQHFLLQIQQKNVRFQNPTPMNIKAGH